MDSEVTVKYKKKLKELCEKKQYKQALRLITEELKTNPDAFHLLKYKVFVLDMLNKNKDVVIAANIAISIKLDDYVFYVKGCSLCCLGEFSEAILAFDSSLAIKPNFHGAIERKISTLIRLGRYKEAVKLYEENDLSASDGDSLLNNLGHMYLKLENYDRAGQFLYSAKGLNPYEPAVYYNLAQIYKIKKDYLRFYKHFAMFVFLFFIKKIGIYKILVKFAVRREFPVGTVFFNGPGKLFKSKDGERETKAILKLLRDFNATSLCNDTWEWFAVNIPYEAVEKNGFKGDIDIILKRPRYLYPGGPDAGVTYRGFQVKISVVNMFGKIEKIQRGKRKYEEIKKQLTILKKFGCEQIFLLELFVLERGYSTFNIFPNQEIRNEILNKAKYLKKLGFGYVVIAEEPSTTHDDESGGVAHIPINVLETTTNNIGVNFKNLVDGIDNVYHDHSLNDLLKNLPRQEAFNAKIGYCLRCKKLTMIIPIGYTFHICGFCRKGYY